MRSSLDRTGPALASRVSHQAGKLRTGRKRCFGAGGKHGRFGIALLLLLSAEGVFALDADQVNSFICFGLDLTHRPTMVEYSGGRLVKLEYDNNTVTVKTYYKKDSADYMLRKITYVTPYLIEANDYNLGNVETTIIITLDADQHLKQIKEYSTLYFSCGNFLFTGSGYHVEYTTDTKDQHSTKGGSVEIVQPQTVRIVSGDTRADLVVTQVDGRTYSTKMINSDGTTTTATYYYSSE